MQAQYRRAADEETILAFKRHILSASQEFAARPEEDLFRVNLLGQMLDRYDELSGKGLSTFTCRNRVIDEFCDIPARMRAQGFDSEDGARAAGASRWPQLSEAEAARYMKERDAYLHRIALGVMMCTACVTPVLLGAGLAELFFGFAYDVFAVLGVAGMFGMIGTGVYTITSAKKPEKEKAIKKGQFSLGMRLKKQLQAMKETVWEKTRRRTAKGIGLIIACLIPLFLGIALDIFFITEFFSILGCGGMFVMIGAGVYELIMADGEKKTVGRLLKAGQE